MSGFFKKRFTKWSMISALGLSAYFLGFSFGTKELGKEIAHQAFEARLADLRNEQRLASLSREPAHSQNDPDTVIFLPSSEQTANLSQTK